MLFTPDGGELPTTKLPDEILTPGKGQIKALLVAGGNPASAFPNQVKAISALRSLELLIAVEPFLNSTARLAHYVIPPRLMYERVDVPMMLGDGRRYPRSFAQYTPAAVDVPAGSDLTEDWRFFWDLGRRLGRKLKVDGKELDMECPPTTDEFIDLLVAGSRVPIDEVRSHPHGKIFDHEQIVLPASSDARFDVMPDDVADELRHCLAEMNSHQGKFPHLLINRRTRNAMNSLAAGPFSGSSRKPYNPAFLNPDDIAAFGLQPGGRIEIASVAGRLTAIVEPDNTLRRGVVSMTHCWGGLPDDPFEVTKGAASTSLLIDSENDLESINAMPRMTAVPVRIKAVD
jgi:anaerobic selenocysteine-containing dehydrogenase